MSSGKISYKKELREIIKRAKRDLDTLIKRILKEHPELSEEEFVMDVYDEFAEMCNDEFGSASY